MFPPAAWASSGTKRAASTVPDARGQVVAGTGAEAVDGVVGAVLGERHGVVPRGDVDQAGCVLGRHGVQRRVDQAEGMVSHLVGQCDDAGEQRRGLARPAGHVPAGLLAGEALVGVHQPRARPAHRDVGHASLVSDDAGHTVLVRGPGEDHRLAAAAWRAGWGRRRRRRPLATPVL